MEKRAINILLLSVLMSLAVLLMPVGVSAETETDTAPTVMYKLINHDCIKLKWDEVAGADGYYIYRTDTGTGKTVKYKSIVIGTDVTIKNLSAETEYIFYVEPMTGKNGKMTVGQRSVGTKLTTPKEWYCYAEYDVDYDKEIFSSHFYRENYSKTVKEEINLGDIKSADEIIYYDGWYYVLGDKAAIKADKNYPWERKAGLPRYKCVARIKKDGTGKEILFDDFATAEGYNYKTCINSDHIYIYRSYYDNENDIEYKDKLSIIPYDISDFYNISLKTGTVTMVCDVYILSRLSFDVNNENIYYTYNELGHNMEENIYFYRPYEYKDGKYNDLHGEYRETLCKVMTDGTDKTVLKDIGKYDEIKHNEMIYYYNDNVFFYTIRSENSSIFAISVNEGKIQKLCTVPKYISEFKIINGYIYCTLYSEEEKPQYVRINIDNSETTTQDTPFEWYY